MAASSRASRPTPSRSLPSITVFSHPAARLVKTVPQLQPPNRVNAHVPRDTLGVGRTSPTDVVLTDIYGPLSLLVVPDPLDPNIATLIISINIQDANLQGAARRFVLPFRSFQRNPDTGELVSRSKINGFDAADRAIYPGLGAGLKGLDGGSFWFFEDVGEQGALDRFRWQKDNVGRRAIWTVWLISTPAPVVLYVQQLLQSYPISVPPLPPWLKERKAYPWQDSYLQHTLSPPSAPHQAPPTSASQSPLPSNPLVASEPQHLRATSAELSHDPSDISNQDTPSPQQGLSASIDSQVGRSLAQMHPASNLSVRSKHLRDGSSSVIIGDTPQVVLRDPSRTSALPEYRNSLVAVDNLTGQVVGVLASHVDLETSPSSPTGARHISAGSSHGSADADADADHEAQTPLDEHACNLQHSPSDLALGLHTQSKLLPELPSAADTSTDGKDFPTSRTSRIVQRPVTIYHDLDAQRPRSRPTSILDAETFSPPPLPPKLASKQITDDVPSRRTSTASAAFLTADSEIDAMSSYDSDAFEIDAHTITHYNLPPSSTSTRARGAAGNVTTHRPELLHDPHLHDDVDSDASGSTVGGPAVRMWRKARGKPKKKPKAATEPAVQARPLRQPSELSDRTSKAETALEAFSDDEAVHEHQNRAQAPTAGVTLPSVGHPKPLPVPDTRPRQHLARTELCTDQVRSIEDRVWREALDNGQLPIDAPYTHLAARGDAGFYPSSILSSPRSIADGSAIELVSIEDKTCQLQRTKWKQQQQNQRAERIKHMQGGTVLIEFLAGSSRIGASLIRSAGLDTDSNHLGASTPKDNVDTSSKDIDRVTNVFGYMPLLPQHLLSFLGLSSGLVASATPKDVAASSTQPAVTSFATWYLPNLRLPAIPDWVSSLFGFNPFASTAPPATDGQAEDDPSRAEEWEYVIPEFDPNSLSSTPRPIYRRKRPVPSFTNGFNISAPVGATATSPAANETDSRKEEIGVIAARPSSAAQSAISNENRYSILHFDSLGVGRRAFLRGMPGVNGACF